MLRVTSLRRAVSSIQPLTSCEECQVVGARLGSQQGLGREGLVLDLVVMRDEAEAARGVERVDHVQVVRPGLRPVLPRMRARVRADVTALPVAWRARRVMRLQRLA
jgi:hypothetical protein